VVRLYRGQSPDLSLGGEALLGERFPDGHYVDVPGLCRRTTLDEIATTGWSLNPGRYVRPDERPLDDADFAARLEGLNEEFVRLTEESHELEEVIAEQVSRLLGSNL
jgi:type I restriction enzyme M protein